ncbi:WD40 repeat domain-containing protein [Streptomyces sp. NPDC050658]|uniref:WD40 repeat domain-containing protein n=1 Tax=unclassified Streptomyces TaxID=2593676 RepID=UPI00342481A3
MHSLRRQDNRWSRTVRLLIHLLPGAAAAIGALLGLVSADRVTPAMAVLTALLVVTAILFPPIVDRLRERAARQAEHQRGLAQRLEGAAAERAEQLRGHFRPRGRGVLPSSLREGSYFAGRVRVLSELTAWINGGGSDVARSRVVTGAPGSGKSAVLGRLVSLADAGLRGETPAAPGQDLPEIGALCTAVHVRGRTVDEVAAEMSRALTIDETTAGGLLAHLREAREQRTTVAVVDGVDEAADPQRLVVDLLEPLAAASGRTGVRLLVGTRRGGADSLLRLFGGSARVIDLDEDRYLDQRDIADYVRLTLLAQSDPRISTPYRSRPELAASVGAAVAVRSGRSFLVAQLTALSLMAAGEPVDTDGAGWQETFPTTVGAAMERYLHDVQPGGPWLRDLLMALAWSQGDGFGDPRTWAAAATALGTDTYAEQDVTRLLLDTTAIDLLHRTERGPDVRFRLFHEALGEHLRRLSVRQRPPAEIHRRLSEVLLRRLPTTPSGGPRWADADAYTRTYLPFHAGKGGVLDGLLRDATFLAAVEPARLLAALPEARTPSGRRAARTIERVGQQLLVASEEERVCYLEMAARMAGDEELAASLCAAFPDRPWAVRWAHWDDLVASRMLGHHDDYVIALATVEHPRGAVVLSASEWAVQAWFLRDGAPLPSGVREPASAIVDMAAVTSRDGIAVVTLHRDGRLLRTKPDATEGQHVLANRRALHGVWPVVIGGDAAVATVSEEGVLEIRSVEDGRLRDLPRMVLGEEERVLTVGDAGGRCLAVVTTDEAEVSTWDVESARPIGEPFKALAEIPDWRAGLRVWAASIAEHEGGPVLILGTQTGVMVAWDPVRATRIGELYSGGAGVFSTLAVGRQNELWCWGDWNGDLFMRSSSHGATRRIAMHDGGVESVAQCEQDGSCWVITGGRDGAVRVWDSRAESPAAPANEFHGLVAGGAGDASARESEENCVAALGADGRLVIFDVETGDIRAETGGPDERRCRSVAALRGDPASFVTLDAEGRFALRRFPYGEVSYDVRLPEDEEWIRIAVLGRERPLLLATAVSGRLGFFGLASGEPPRPSLRCHAGRFWVAPLPEQPDDALRFVTWDWEQNETRLWSVGGDEASFEDLVPPARTDAQFPLRITGISFGRVGHVPVVVGVGSFSQLVVWNAEDGSLMAQAQLERGHYMELTDVDMAQYGRRSIAVTGGHTCSVGLWSLEGGQEHHVRVGSPLWRTRVLPAHRVVMIGPRGIMAVELRPRAFDRLLGP